MITFSVVRASESITNEFIRNPFATIRTTFVYRKIMSKIAVGIDVGTSEIKIVVAENAKKENGGYFPVVLAKVSAHSYGLRHGYVINSEEVTESVRNAVHEAEKIAKIKIKKVYLSVGGIGLSSIISKGYAMTSKADSEITDLDMRKV